MQIVHFVKPYRTQETLYNAGEFAGFPDKEAAFIVEKKVGRPAKAVRILKGVTRDEALQTLGKSWELRRGARAGQALTLVAEKAEQLIKDGFAEELVTVTVLKSFTDKQGHARETGTFACSKAEFSEYRKAGHVDAFVHPTDENDAEADEIREQEELEKSKPIPRR